MSRIFTLLFTLFFLTTLHAAEEKSPLERGVSPAELTEADRTLLFGHMPAARQPEVLAKLAEFEQTLIAFCDLLEEVMPYEQKAKMKEDMEERQGVNLFVNLVLNVVRPEKLIAPPPKPIAADMAWLYASISQAFAAYPAICDPAREAEYWQRSTDELLEIIDASIAEWEEDRLQNAESLSLYRMSPEQRGDRYIWSVTEYDRVYWHSVKPTAAMQERLAAGRPCFVNPHFLRRWHLFIHDSAHTPGEYVRSFRTENTDDWVPRTPNLAALALTDEQLSRWDGSTSLEPLVQLIVLHVKMPVILRDGENCGFDWITLERDSDDYSHWYTAFSQTHGSIKNVIIGERDLAFSAREPSEDELALAKENGVELVSVPFARDALVFVTNRINPVENLTQAQIRGIFTGKLTQWKQVGGFGESIMPLVRNRNSGSEELMRGLTLAATDIPDDFTPHTVQTMGGIFDNLERNLHAIGYSVRYYEQYLMRNPATRSIAVDGVSPTSENIASGAYPYTFPCVLIHRKNPDAMTAKFVAWMLSDEGQRVVGESGYVPLRMQPPKNRPSRLTSEDWQTLLAKIPAARHPEIQAKLREMETLADAVMQNQIAVARHVAPTIPPEFWSYYLTPDSHEEYAGMAEFLGGWRVRRFKKNEKLFQEMETCVGRMFPDVFSLIIAAQAYPDVLDPAGQTQFWRDTADELGALLDSQVADFRQRQGSTAAALERVQNMKPEAYWDEITPLFAEKYKLDVFIEPACPRLSPEQLRRQEAGQPWWRNPAFTEFYRQNIWKIRDKEPEPPKIATPQFAALNLKPKHFKRWAGSYGAEPFWETVVRHYRRLDAANKKENFWAPEYWPTANPVEEIIYGTKDFAMILGMLTDEEKAQAADAGVTLVETHVASGALVFLVNRYNAVTNLTPGQLADIYAGKVTQWKDVSGHGGTITPIPRNKRQTEYPLFCRMVMQNAAPLKEFFPTESGVGFSAVFHFSHGLDTILHSFHPEEYAEPAGTFARTVSINGILPTPATIASGEYPLTYPCTVIHRKNPDAATAKFVAWMLSDEGQRVVGESGYVPINPMK